MLTHLYEDVNVTITGRFFEFLLSKDNNSGVFLINALSYLRPKGGTKYLWIESFLLTMYCLPTT